MLGVLNRVAHVVCEVGTCFVEAAFTEYVHVIPGDPALRNERHQIDIVLCHEQENEFQRSGLLGTITAYGDHGGAASMSELRSGLETGRTVTFFDAWERITLHEIGTPRSEPRALTIPTIWWTSIFLKCWKSTKSKNRRCRIFGQPPIRVIWRRNAKSGQT